MDLAVRSLRLLLVVVLVPLLTTVTPTGSASAKIATDDFYSARVPSVCGQPAGKLVHGRLPGIPEGQGQVRIAASRLIATGRLVRPGRPGGAMVLACDQGGQAWPHYVVAYTPHLEVMARIFLADLTHGSNERVRKIWIEQRTLHLHIVDITASDEAACCGTRSAVVHLKWSASRNRFVITKKVIFSEVKPARQLLKAVKVGDRQAAGTRASADVVDDLFDLQAQGRLTLGDCTAPGGASWPINYDGTAKRSCLVALTRESGYESGYALMMQPTGWNGWRAVDVIGIAG